jgi:hypothetical protein
MMHRMWARGLAGLCALTLCTGVVWAQEKKPGQEPKKEEAKKPEAPKADKPEAGKGQPEVDPAMAEMMKKCQEFATPGDDHKRLEPLVGKWEFSTSWRMSPDAPADVSKGKAEYKWIFDGRYLQQECTGEPCEAMGGMILKGLGVTGYDNMRKQYFCSWFDNMGTGVMMGYGTADASGKVITMEGDFSNPMTGNQHEKWRTITRIESPDKHIFEMYGPDPSGKEFKCMEITYTRAK